MNKKIFFTKLAEAFLRMYCRFITWHDRKTGKVCDYENLIILNEPGDGIFWELRQLSYCYSLSKYNEKVQQKKHDLRMDNADIEKICGYFKHNNSLHGISIIIKNTRGELVMLGHKRELGFYKTNESSQSIIQMLNLKNRHEKSFANKFYFGFPL